MHRRLHVWLWHPDSVDAIDWPRIAALVSPDERARAKSFYFERHQKQYLAAHALKRALLSELDGRPPQAWQFEIMNAGKPRVLGGHGPHFNLSHAEGLVACAASTDVDPGIDVEGSDQHISPEFARELFTKEECSHLARLPAKAQETAAVSLWTLREAYVKATGLGLEQIASVSFELEPVRAIFHDTSQGDPKDWQWRVQSIADKHLLALAWRGSSVSIDFRSVCTKTILK